MESFISAYQRPRGSLQSRMGPSKPPRLSKVTGNTVAHKAFAYDMLFKKVVATGEQNQIGLRATDGFCSSVSFRETRRCNEMPYKFCVKVKTWFEVSTPEKQDHISFLWHSVTWRCSRLSSSQQETNKNFT